MTPLGLTLYNLTARPDIVARAWPVRPAGRLIWLHVSAPSHVAAAMQLAQRLQDDSGFLVLLTWADPQGIGTNFIQDAPPDDAPKQVAAFLGHYTPDVIVLIGAVLRPALIAGAHMAGVPIILTQAAAPELLRGSDRVFLGLTRHLVAYLAAVMTVDETAARIYRRLGAANVQRTGHLEAHRLPLPHNEPERAAMAAMLATRPVWLAVDVPQIEIPAVIAAHRSAMRLSHRLLLILVPQDATLGESLAAQLEQDEGWIVARRDLDQDPDPETVVYIADAGQEYGLWYRLAPVTFMGGTMFGTGSARAPFEAAALGSAIIHGRKTGDYGREYGQLGAALGAAAVSSVDELAEFLTELLAPDRVARLAHAAWGVVSEGAEVTHRIQSTVLHLAERKR
ncbi:MAG: glycosyltransferase N-terminal domain-containing protein [Cypionkella sp.]|nr:glycosyltransferase N-terminal domain-containing protein [Cypionkella sp.]